MASIIIRRPAVKIPLPTAIVPSSTLNNDKGKQRKKAASPAASPQPIIECDSDDDDDGDAQQQQQSATGTATTGTAATLSFPEYLQKINHTPFNEDVIMTSSLAFRQSSNHQQQQMATAAEDGQQQQQQQQQQGAKKTTAKAKSAQQQAASRRKLLIDPVIMEQYGEAAQAFVDGTAPKHVEFIELLNLNQAAESKFWRVKLREFAYGIFPTKKFIYENGVLILKTAAAKRPPTASKKKVNVVPTLCVRELLQHDPATLFENLKQFIRVHTGLASGDDISHQIREQEEQMRMQEEFFKMSRPRSWADIDKRRKDIRLELICRFIEAVADEMGMFGKERITLVTLVRFAMEFGIIADQDIVLDTACFRIIQIRDVRLGQIRPQDLWSFLSSKLTTSVDTESTTGKRKKRAPPKKESAATLAADEIQVPSIDMSRPGPVALEVLWQKFLVNKCKKAEKINTAAANLTGTIITSRATITTTTTETAATSATATIAQ